LTQPGERLLDLLEYEFIMDKTDKDFKMSHVQLIKVCKVLLHKLSTQDKKFISLNEQLQTTIENDNF